jgi:hypothetical protein
LPVIDVDVQQVSEVIRAIDDLAARVATFYAAEGEGPLPSALAARVRAIAA